MANAFFNPFEDRLARDVRNELSEAFPECLELGDIGPAQKRAEWRLRDDLSPIYREYIENRIALYREALKAIAGGNVRDDFARALILWDLGLFFEVHEVLELAWLKASGPYKLVLQAMIRAAGFYIKGECGYNESAAKIAGRAVEALEANRQAVPPGFELDRLLHALRTLNPVPPKLRTAG